MYTAPEPVKQGNDMIKFVFGNCSWKMHQKVERLEGSKSIRKILFKNSDYKSCSLLPGRYRSSENLFPPCSSRPGNKQCTYRRH